MNIVDTIKSKSDQMVNIYKEDLKEFSNSLLGDTSTILSTQLDNVKQYIPASATAVLEGLQENNSNTTSPRNTTTTTTTNTTTSPSSFLGKSNLLKSSLSFFTSEPGDIQEFELWCRDFGEIDSHSLEINTILSGDEAIKSLYLQYVPSKATHQQFWLKYFYKQYKSRKEEERRKLILEQVSKDEEIGWDDDDDDEEEEKEEVKEDEKQEQEEKEDEEKQDTVENVVEIQQQQQEDKELSLKKVQEISNTTVNNEKEDVYIDSDDELDQMLEMKYQEELKQKQDTPVKLKEPQQPSQSIEKEDIALVENDATENLSSIANNNNNNITTTTTNSTATQVINDEEDVFDWE